MEATNPGTLSDVRELEAAFARLETAISEASLAITALRSCLHRGDPVCTGSLVPTGTSTMTPVLTAKPTNTPTPPPVVGGISIDRGAVVSPERTASHRDAAFPFAAIALVGISCAAGAVWFVRRRHRELHH